MAKKNEQLSQSSSSSPMSALSGTFTRSRSEMFLHRTRSGLARPDPNRHRCSVTVKDLRSKRVFSDLNPKITADQIDGGGRKRSRSDDSGPDLDATSGFDGGEVVSVSEKAKLGDSDTSRMGLSPCSQSKSVGNLSSIAYNRKLGGKEILQPKNCSAEVKTTMKEMAQTVDTGDSHIVYSGENHTVKEKLCLEDPTLTSLEHIVHKSTKVESPRTCNVNSEVATECDFNGTIKEGEGCEVDMLNASDGCIGDVVWRTPVGAELAGKYEVAEIGSGKNILESISNCTSAIRSGLSSCSRSKLIVNPSSVSYRRLLPYLKDLTKDGSAGIEILQAKNNSTKVEKILKESSDTIPLVDSLVSSGEKHHLKENLVSEKPTAGSHEDIVHKPLMVESPNSCCKDKLLIHQNICKEVFIEQQLEECNADKQNGKTEERNGSDVILTTSDGCIGDIGQSTPPDSLLTNKLEAEVRSGKNILEPGLSNASRNRSGLVSRSMSKLYQNPHSFSYRRLLPFLMDLAKNDTSDMEVSHSQKCTNEVQKNTGESPLMLNTTPVSSQQNHTITLVDSSAVHTKDNQGPQESSVFEISDLESLTDLHSPLITKLPNSCKKDELPNVQATSQNPLQRSNFEVEVICKPSYSIPNIREDLSVQELAGNVLEISHSPMKTSKKPIQPTSHLGTSDRRAIQALAPRKSILKKQSRGCRGICMCLDCASFRFHAEKVYEFSRKQMIDADEVVEGLMKELLCLRNIVERSLVPYPYGAENYTVPRVNQDQVKGVCQRAFRVEELAKSRMRQIFSDLNMHCRNPGPRVTFSEYIDEQNIL